MERNIIINEPKNNTTIVDDNKPLKVCAYCRVSTDEDDQRNSLSSQKRFFDGFFKKHPNWTNIGIFADEGLSGTSLNKRDEFNRMYSIALSKGVDIILTKEVSRFSRNAKDILNITGELKDAGVYVIFLSNNINTQDDNYRERLTQIAANAESESFSISMRVKWGQQQQMENGIVFGRKEMFGYNIVKDDNGVQHFEIIEEEAETVRKIFEWFASGEGTYKIARRLESMGIKTKRYKNGWSNTVILRILRNEKYAGDLNQGKTYTPELLNHKKRYNTGQSFTCYIENHHPESAIIDRDTWNKVKALLEEKAPDSETKAKHSNRYWTSGKVFCGVCGQRYVSYQKKQKSEPYKAWVCFENHQRGIKKSVSLENGETIDVGCDNKRVNDKVLQQAIHDIITEIIIPNKDSICKSIINDLDTKSTTKNNNKQISSLTKRLEKAKSDLIRLTMRYTEDNSNINDYTYSLTSKSYNEKIATLEQELLSLNKETDDEKLNASIKTRYIEEINKILSFTDKDINEGLYERITKKIVVYPDNILEIYLSFLLHPIYLHYTTFGKGKTYNTSFNVLTNEEISNFKNHLPKINS